MGGSSTKFQQISLQKTHPKLTNSSIIVENNQKFLRIQLPIQEKTFEEWQQKIQEQLQKIYPEFLLLPKRWVYKGIGLCSNTGIVMIDYDNYPYLLIHEINQKREKGQQFDESDIWYLLYALTEAMHDIIPISPFLGDIRPQNIFIDQNGMIKISNFLTWPYYQSAIDQFKEGQLCFLQPEKVQQLKNTKFYAKDQNSSQLFSIGLTLLSVCTLTDLSCLYDTVNCTFNYKALQQKYNQLIFFGKYSQILKATVLNLCNLSREKRVSFQQLHNWIEKHRGKIKSKQNFVLHSVPEKWHDQVKGLRESLRKNLVKMQASISPPISPRATIKASDYFIRSNNEQIREGRSRAPR